MKSMQNIKNLGMKRKLLLSFFVISSLFGVRSYSQVGITIDTVVSASCSNDGSFILSPSNLASGQPYQWDYTTWPASYTGSTSSTTNDTFSNLVSGSYTIKLSYIATGNPFPQNVSATIVVGQYVIDSKDTTVYVNGNGVASFDTSFFLTYLAPSCNFDSVWLNIDSALCAPSTQNIVVSARADNGTVFTSNSTLTVLDTTKPFISILNKSFYFNTAGTFSFDTSDLLGVAIDSFSLSANLSDSLVSSTTWAGNQNAGSGVAFDPNTNLYYSVYTGSFPAIVTYDNSGNELLNSTNSFNSIGLWWNSLTSKIEGGKWMSKEIRVSDRDASNYALGTGIVSNVGSPKPSNGSAGTFIASSNEVVYYSSGSIIKYDRGTHTQNSSVTLNNMPAGTFHNDFVGYTGVTGAEIVLYNLTSKSVCYFDLGTGNFIGSVSLPSSATANNSYYTAFANNRIWLNSNAAQSKWYGYEMPNIFSNTKGNPSDNCGIASVTLSDTMVSCSNSSVLVTATITDNSGNTFTSSATMTGIDTIKPIVTNLDTVRIYLTGNSVTMDTSLLTTSVVENCELDTIRYSLTEVNCSDDTVVVYVFADDKSGNVGVDSSVVVVLDTLAPVISCHDTALYLNNLGNVSYDTSHFITSISDVCLDSVWISSTDTNCTSDTINVTIYARDASGNIDSCISKLAVIDTLNPTITCMDTTIYLDSMGMATIDTSFVQNGFADNCGVDSVWMGNTTFNCSSNNDSVTVYVRDNSGNMDSCIAIVTIIDTIAPSLVTNDSIVVYKNSAGLAVIDTSMTVDSIFENCLVDSAWTGVYTEVCNNDTATIYTYVMDAAGNLDSASTVVIVLDTLPPALVCTDTIVYLDATGNVSFDTSYVLSSVSQCGLDSVWMSYISANCSNDSLIVTLYARNVYGLINSCDAIVTVLDTISPSFNGVLDTLVYLDSMGVASYDTSMLLGYRDPVFLTSYRDVNANVMSFVYNPLNDLYYSFTARGGSNKITTYRPDGTIVSTVTTSADVRGAWWNSNRNQLEGVGYSNYGQYVFFLNSSGTALGTYSVASLNDPKQTAQNYGSYNYDDDLVIYTTNYPRFYEYTRNGHTITRFVHALIPSTGTYNTNFVGYTGLAGSEYIYYDYGSKRVYFVNKSNGSLTSAFQLPSSAPSVNSWGISYTLDGHLWLFNSSTSEWLGYDLGLTPPRPAAVTDNCDIDSVWQDSYDTTCIAGGTSVVVSITAMDNSGNTSTVISNVSVLDTIAPSLVAQNKTVYLDSTGSVSFDTSNMIVSTYDNCSIDTILMDITSATCADDSVNVTLTITDENGNSSTTMATVYVLDTIAPNVILANDTLYIDATGNASNSLSDINNGSNDNCGIASITLSDSVYTCNEAGLNTVLVTVTDSAGNVAVDSAIVTVLDTLLPTITCIDTTVYLDVTGSVTIDTSFVQTGFADNCGVDSVWSSMNTTFTCSDSIQEVTLYVRDNSGNIDSCVANVTVLDTIAPNLIAQNKTVYLDATGSVSFDTSAMIVSTYDNCTVDAISMDITSATCADDSVNVMLTITDENGNSSTTMATVYVLDTIAPNVILANDTLYLDATGNASNSLSDINNGSNDNCGIASITLSDSVYTCNEAGLNTVTVTVTDNSGNISTNSATVFVIDSIDLIAMCKNLTLYLDTTGNASLVASDIDNGSSGNCGSAILSASQTTFTCADLGQTFVTLTVTSGVKVDSCIASVQVQDIYPPIAICQPATIYLDASGVATLAASDIDNGSSDNCSVSLSISQTTFNCSDLGANTVTLTATDAQGLTSTCTTTVTILDTLAPMMVCQSVTVNLDASGIATIATTDVNNGSTDNCSGVTLSLSQTTFSCTDLGASMVTLTGTDASGNTSTCMATVTVVDGINPISLCKPATIYLDSNGDARLLASDIDNGSSDNCSVTVTITDSLFTCSDAGANNVTLTATDGDGNTSTCVAVVTVLDTISPIANCKADTLYLNAAGTASLTAAMINDGSSDNCTFTMSVSQSTFTCSDMGVGSATLTVTDASGNTSTCTSAITVMDTLAPMMSCTPVTIYLDAMGMATLTASQVDGGSTDNCGIATMSVSRSSFTCADMGTTTVTLTGTDASGNTSTCTTTVTILDTLAPVVLCKSATVVLDATGTATITTLDVDNGSTDNCGITLSLSNNTFNCTNVGANTVTLTGTDASGNTSSCSATVTVIDNMAPTAICQNITISLDGNGQATILANDIDAGSFDNCTVSGVTLDKTDFDCSNVGRNIVTLTVTDLYGNVSTCTATVTVEDNVAPVVFCPADKNRTVRNTTCTYVVEDFAWETSNTDNCAANGTTTEQFPAAGTEVVAENGRVTITIVTRDASMNADSCTFDVIVNCERELDIPEFISPNGDGMNDYWDLTELSSYTNNTIKIFNRYGTLVFEQRGYTNQFVGRGNVSNSLGEGQLPEGTYFYVIDLGDNNVDKKVYNGYVQIKR